MVVLYAETALGRRWALRWERFGGALQGTAVHTRAR